MLPNFLQVLGHIEVSRDVVSVSPNKSQGSERKLMSKAKMQRQRQVFILFFYRKRNIIGKEENVRKRIRYPHNYNSAKYIVKT